MNIVLYKTSLKTNPKVIYLLISVFSFSRECASGIPIAVVD